MTKFTKQFSGKTLWCAIAFFAVFYTANAANGTFGGGNGQPGTHYIIQDAADLDAVRNDLDAHYQLVNDIDLTDYLATGGEGYDQWGNDGWMPIGGDADNPFTGTFSGDGYKITGLWIDRDDTYYVGLFGFIEDASIENLGVEIAEAGVKGYIWVGGLVGVNNGYIYNCYTTGNVFGANESVGGLAGVNDNMISCCYATGNVAGVNEFIGGLVGYNWSTVSNSYATGKVNGNKNVGGFVGFCQLNSTIENCYATGNVTGNSNVGGFVGENCAEITNSFFDTETSGQAYGVGQGEDLLAVIGKTTAEMKQQLTYTSWDFSTIWGICENSCYPFFQWQGIACHTLTFAGEAIAIPPQSVAHGNHATAPETPERIDYDFAGWFTDNNTFANEWVFETDIVTQDTMLYAKWTPKIGMEEMKNANIKIYPNPVKEMLQIKNNARINRIEILDLLGKVIYQFNNSGNQINVSALPQGIYFVKLETEKETVIQKFVKE